MFSWTLHRKGLPIKDSCAAVAVGRKLYYFGRNLEENEDGTTINVDVFDTVSLLWRKLAQVTPGGEPTPEVPFRRSGYTAVLIEDITYLWGGRDFDTYEYCKQLHAFDVNAHRWFKPQVFGAVPEGRYHHSACVLGKVMYIHGGLDLYGNTYGHISKLDTNKLDTNTMVWSLINTGGTPAYRHSATIIGTKMFVFGGYRGAKLDSAPTPRVFDTETNHWLDTPSTQPLPDVRYGHSAFTYNGELYIFGGLILHKAANDLWKFSSVNDLWKFNPDTFSWRKVQPKGKSPSSGLNEMCCCMVGDRVILFGGVDRPNDLHVVDLSPSLKTLCKQAVIQYGLEQAGLSHNIRWELAAMTSNSR